MNHGTQLCINRTTETSVAEHLRVCAKLFIPPLGERVLIENYSRKIVENAERVELWFGDRLIGLVCVYCNKPETKTAFVTSVSVVPNWHKRGVGTLLIERTLIYVRSLGFDQIELEVDCMNNAAVALYKKDGFVPLRTLGRTLSMVRKL